MNDPIERPDRSVSKSERLGPDRCPFCMEESYGIKPHSPEPCLDASEFMVDKMGRKNTEARERIEREFKVYCESRASGRAHYNAVRDVCAQVGYGINSGMTKALIWRARYESSQA